MKTFYFLAFLLFQVSISFSQQMKDLHIVGISAEAEQKIVPGDRISHYTYETGNAYNNIKVQFKSEKGTKRIYTALDVNPDANGHYTINKKIQVKESSKVTFEGELEILISIETIYKNSFWTKITRTKDNLTDPIVLDHYTKKASIS